MLVALILLSGLLLLEKVLEYIRVSVHCGHVQESSAAIVFKA